MKVQYIDHMGNDMRVVNMARQSFGKLKDETLPLDDKDQNLIKFLATGLRKKEKDAIIEALANTTNPQEIEALIRKHNVQKHWVPFAHCQFSLRMSAPVPIRTQMFKHKIGMVESEESRRYVDDEPTIYIPDYFAARPEKDIKQGSAGVHYNSDKWKQAYTDHVKESVSLYMEMIADGVAPEDARFILPQGTEVNWGWTGSLFAFASVYRQRNDAHAQRQSQYIAKEIDSIIRPLFPYSWSALVD